MIAALIYQNDPWEEYLQVKPGKCDKENKGYCLDLCALNIHLPRECRMTLLEICHLIKLMHKDS